MERLFEAFSTQCCVSSRRLPRNLFKRYSLIDIFLKRHIVRATNFFQSHDDDLCKEIGTKEAASFNFFSFCNLDTKVAAFSLLVKLLATMTLSENVIFHKYLSTIIYYQDPS